MFPWIDTHNHLFVLDSQEQAREVSDARRRGLGNALICAGGTDHFAVTQACARRFGFGYALGLHPLWIRESWQADLTVLRRALEAASASDDPHLIAVGECGLDFSAACPVDREIQERVLSEHFRIARNLKLPLSLHGREAMDTVLKYIRRFAPLTGVIHAFNGSAEQARQFIKLGFKLGYGGAMTYEGSRRIRALFGELAADAWVLETDCPDMPAVWRRTRVSDVVGQSDRYLSDQAAGQSARHPVDQAFGQLSEQSSEWPSERTSEQPASRLEDIARYGEIAAHLRGVSLETISEAAYRNTLNVFPRFSRLRADVAGSVSVGKA